MPVDFFIFFINDFQVVFRCDPNMRVYIFVVCCFLALVRLCFFVIIWTRMVYDSHFFFSKLLTILSHLRKIRFNNKYDRPWFASFYVVCFGFFVFMVFFSILTLRWGVIRLRKNHELIILKKTLLLFIKNYSNSLQLFFSFTISLTFLYVCLYYY